MNSCHFIGRLTADPELRTVGGEDTKVATFTIAVNRPYNKNKEERTTDFIRCTAWRGAGETIAKFFKKGNMIGIVGSLRIDNNKNDDGTYNSFTSVVVKDFDFIEKKNSEDSDTVNNYNEEPDTDDGLPF